MTKEEMVLMFDKYGDSAHYKLAEIIGDDKEMALVAIDEFLKIFKYLNDNLKNDKEVVLEAIRRNIKALDYVSKDLKNDNDYITITKSSNLIFGDLINILVNTTTEAIAIDAVTAILLANALVDSVTF